MHALKSIVVAGVTVLAAVAASTPAQADNGYFQTSVNTVVEGEGYWWPDAACDPDYDGEHTHPQTSGNTFAFLPHSGCGVNYGSMYFSRLSIVDGVFATVYAGASQAVITVYLDGKPIATATNHAQWEYSTANPSGIITPGYHTMRVQYDVTVGPGYSNMNLDFVALRALV